LTEEFGEEMTDAKPDKSETSIQSEKTADQAESRVRRSTGSARLGRDVRQKIGQQLRAMYDDFLKEPVPDKFRNMLG